MRAIAVLMMIQGHTIDVLLNEESRDLSSSIYLFWQFLRGMTAPLFLFISGAVFTYLFLLQKKSFSENPRVKKGIRRAALLIFLGYLLRSPANTIIPFHKVSEQSVITFFAVDVLQLIGFGLIFIIAACLISEKLKINNYITFLIFAVIAMLLYPLCDNVNWLEYVHRFFAGYLYKGSGSNFPLFPWLVYMFTGATFGTYLAKNSVKTNFKVNSFSLLSIGVSLVILSYFGSFIEYKFLNIDLWEKYFSLIFYRLGFVFIFNASVAYITSGLKTIPNVILIIGRSTLLIYVVHLIILYGSAWNIGINVLYSRTLEPLLAIASAAAMLSLMILLALGVHYIKLKKKKFAT